MQKEKNGAEGSFENLEGDNDEDSEVTGGSVGKGKCRLKRILYKTDEGGGVSGR